MDKLCLDNYIPKPKPEIFSQKQEQKKVQNEAPQNPITRGIKEFVYTPKIIMSNNKVREAALAFFYNNYQYKLEIQNIIMYAKNIDSYNDFQFTALNQKLYLFNTHLIAEYDKEVIFKDIPDTGKDKLNALFNAIYERCTEFQKNNLWYNYIQYYNFFLTNCDTDSISDFDKFFGFLPNFNNVNNNRFLLTNNQRAIFILNKKIVIAVGNDILDYNAYFFYNHIKIKSKKYSKYLENLIIALTKYIHATLENKNLKDEINDKIFTYIQKRAYYIPNLKLNYSDEKIYIQDYRYDYECENKNNDKCDNNIDICINPITINNDDMALIRRIDNHIPETFLKALEKLSPNDLNIVKNLAVLIANCFLPYPVSKKLFVINTENEHDIQIVKNFIRSILHSNANDCEIINEDLDHTINSFCSNKMRGQLNALRFSNIKAIFLKRCEENLSNKQAEVLSALINNTSNNTNYKTVNNIQLILFQCDRNINDLREDDVILIDLSSQPFDESIESIPEKDLVWARIYFALYGYTVIKKQKSSVSKDSSELSESDFVDKILNEFINECFVSPEEAAERAKSRKSLIDKIKAENPGIEEDELTEKLADFPIYVTFRDEFKRYIQKFIETQYDTDIIKKYDITPEKLLKAFKNNEIYSKTYPFSSIHLAHITHKPGSAFKYLSLKEPWHKLEIKLESQNVNNIAHKESQNKNICLSLYDEIKREIDFSRVRFPEINARIKIT